MNVVFIGSGNVATHIAKAFKASGANITQVWSKHREHATALSVLVDAQVIPDLENIDPSADLYVIAVKDDAIAAVSCALSAVNGTVVHTSGATDISVLSGIRNFGVIYPLQTFSKDTAISFTNVPLCIEAKDSNLLGELKEIAGQLSPLIYEVDSERRRILHLAAVFACNFVNHLYTLSDRVLQHNGLNFELLKPLIAETALKVQTQAPVTVQTGPAVRNDVETMAKHLDLLVDMPELKEIYQTLSSSIKKHTNC